MPKAAVNVPFSVAIRDKRFIKRIEGIFFNNHPIVKELNIVCNRLTMTLRIDIGNISQNNISCKSFSHKYSYFYDLPYPI